MDGVLSLMYCNNLLLAVSPVLGMQWRMSALKKIRRQREDLVVQQRLERSNIFREECVTRRLTFVTINGVTPRDWSSLGSKRDNWGLDTRIIHNKIVYVGQCSLFIWNRDSFAVSDNAYMCL